jgi:DnaJ-domain-containing protein 1
MQIFDRISRIFKAGIADKSNYGRTFFESEDDELKRIIDELNSNGKSEKNDKKQEDYSPKDSSQHSELDDALKVLGLNSFARNDSIKATYKKKMKEFHPDKVSHLSDEIRKRAEIRAMEINEAYTKIKKIRGF